MVWTSHLGEMPGAEGSGTMVPAAAPAPGSTVSPLVKQLVTIAIVALVTYLICKACSKSKSSTTTAIEADTPS